MFDKILEWDRNIFLALNTDGGPFWDSFFGIVTGKIIWIPLYALILWLVYRKYGLKNTFFAFIGFIFIVVVADHICNFFKDNIIKLRPSHNPEIKHMVHIINNYKGALTGTVSAHAAISFGITTFSSFLLRSRTFTVCMILWASLVSYSRIYVGLHYPLDLIFGALTGFLVGFLTTKLYFLLIKKLNRPLENL